MLEFFRKYQRYFFIFITTVVIASFSFFGTFSTFMNEEKRDERVVAQSIGGSPIRLHEVHQLARFLSSDREDPPARGQDPNFANDGVIRYDFLRTGLADSLAAAYFEPLKEGFRLRLEKAKRFRPYSHPDAPFLSAKAVWEKYVPLINGELAALQAETEVSPAIFSRLSRLYQQQNYLPPELLRRILIYQHQQYGGLGIDQRLAQDDLALFGFHSLAEWFGDDFLNLAAQFILNAAAAAEQKGYRVSLEEAKGDLIRNFEKSMQKLAAAQIKPDWTFQQYLQRIGFDDRSAAEVWKKVLLFRRYFKDVGHAAFVDRLSFQDFASYALETAVVQKYAWPEALHLKSFQDLMEFQIYLKAVCPPAKDPLSLPEAVLSMEEIEKNHPEFVQAEYRVQMAQLTKSQIGLKASMKEVWEWEMEEKNWERLRKRFSFLPKVESRGEKFEALEALEVPFRSEVDAYSRNALVDLHPEWVEEALANSLKLERILAVAGPAASPFVRLPSVEKGEQLADWIVKAASQDPEAIAALSAYSEDGTVFFRFEQVEPVSERQILTFEKARPMLAEITDRYLQDEYLKLRPKFSQKFKNPQGEWKPFSEAKEEVGKIVFADLFKALDKLGPDASSYASLRLAAPARQALEDLKKNPMDPRWLGAAEGNPLLQQFKLERKECSIQRTSKEDWMKEEDFVMMPNQWSPVRISDEGQIAFFYFQEKKAEEHPILDLLSFGKETLAADAQRYLAERLLETAKNQKAIVLPLQGERE